MRIANLLKSNQKKIEISISLVALVVSIGSLISSHKIANEALQISKRVEIRNQSLVLKPKFDYKHESIRVVPQNSDIHLQEAKIYYPDFFDGSPSAIFPKEFDVSISYFQQRLFEYMEQYRKPNSLEVYEGCVPVVIDADYEYFGEVLHTKAMYELVYQLTLDAKEPQIKDTIYYRDLRFVSFDIEIIEAMSDWESKVIECKKGFF